MAWRELLPHFVEVAERARRVLIVWLAASAALGLIPWPGGGPAAVEATRWLIERLVPGGLSLLQASLFAGFNVLVKASLLLGVLAAVPYAAYEFYEYAALGLYPHERRALRLVLASALVSFYAGLAAALTLLLPALMRFYAWAAEVAAGDAGLAAFSDVESLVSIAVQASLSVGVAFQAPLVAWALYTSNVLDPVRVLEERRLVLAASLIVGIAFSPDPLGLGALALAAVVYASLVGVGKIVVWRRRLGALEVIDRIAEGG